ncbi:MAG: hypothetical protein ACJ8FM_19190 [Xanthobacteraceae bacterium]
MRRQMYALRFRGEAERAGIDGSVLRVATGAHGCTICTQIGTEGLNGTVRPAPGDEATLASEWVFTGPTTFQETGTVVFGTGGHRLHFSTAGSAYLELAAEDGRRHGAAIWQIEGGEGQFAGAGGLIASTVVLSDAGEITNDQLGLVLVRTAGGSANGGDSHPQHCASTAGQNLPADGDPIP